MSPTDSVRAYVGHYCHGRGVDIGCGGDKISDEATGIDYLHPYNIRQCGAVTEADIRQPWERALSRFEAGSLDYVYSSHLLEGYPDITVPLRYWAYPLRPGGSLVLCLPIEHLLAEELSRSGPRYYHRRKQEWSGSGDFLAGIPKWFMQHLQLIEASGLIRPCSFYVVFRRRGERR